MLEVVSKGIICGLALALAVGPVFFTLIQASIEKGFVPAAFFATGVFIGDLFYILLVYFGFSQLIENENFKFWLGFGGSLVLILFGIFTLFKKPVVRKVVVQVEKVNHVKQMAQGFILNTLNPFVLIYWMGVISAASLEMQHNKVHLIVFFATTLTIVYSADLLKAFASHKIKKFITYNFLLWLNRISGSVLILFGVRIFYFFVMQVVS
jgi:threonine/homoserine/homoserine lactone efflux protein